MKRYLIFLLLFLNSLTFGDTILMRDNTKVKLIDYNAYKLVVAADTSTIVTSGIDTACRISTNPITQLQIDTGTIRTDVNAIAISTGSLKQLTTGYSTVGYVNGLILGTTGFALQNDLITVKNDTGTLRTDLNFVKTDTGTLRTDLIDETTTRVAADYALGQSTAAIALSTGTLVMKAGDTMTGVLNVSTLSTVAQINWSDGTIQTSSPQAGGSNPAVLGDTTFYFEIGTGGDMFISSVNFVAIMGLKKVIKSTMTVFGAMAYSLGTSSNSCALNVAVSPMSLTSVAGFSYLISSGTTNAQAGLWVSSNTTQGDWVELPATNIYPSQCLAVHCVKLGTTNIPNSEYGVIFKATGKYPE